MQTQPTALTPSPASDGFPFLTELLSKYRRDVHQLKDPPAQDLALQVSERLGIRLPSGLGHFLSIWNGAILFRGALTLRPLENLVAASPRFSQLILFADGPKEGDQWAFSPDGGDGYVFGSANGGTFIPMHSSFSAWLQSTLQIVDRGIQGVDEQLQLRLQTDRNGYLLHAAATAASAAGDENLAVELVREAVGLCPSWPRAWSFLGDCLHGSEPTASAEAHLNALSRCRFPGPHPAFFPDSAPFMRLLPSLPPDLPGFAEELGELWKHRAEDVCSPSGLRLLETVVVALSAETCARGDREASHELLSSFFQRKASFTETSLCARACLAMADVQIDLGLHDEAEKVLRPLLSGGSCWMSAANLRIGRIAVIRQEPWADEILKEAMEGSPDDHALIAEGWVLRGESHLRLGYVDKAMEAFNEAKELAHGQGFAALEGRAMLGLGDVAKCNQRIGSAEHMYQAASDKAVESKNEELHCRTMLRKGDLLCAVGEHEKGYSNFLLAADCFRMMGLPIREGWARLRMGRLGDRPAALYARDLFRTMDFAAGVAVADSVLGEPVASLGWHLERAQEHARRRARAQRAVPPLRRRDADRPERRLGGHRMAISSCSEEIVDALAKEMRVAERDLTMASVLPSNHKYARYVAAADLLSAHRSFKAAGLLLQLVERARPGAPTHYALLGALSRSRNMALVDGILKLLEVGENSVGVAMAAEVMGWRRQRESVPLLLRRLRRGQNINVRRAAVVALGRIGDPSAVEALLPCIEEPELTEQAAVALLLLGEWKGLDEQAQALAHQKPNASQTLGEIVGRYGGPSYLLLLLRAADFEGSQALGAILGLGYLGDPRVVPRLIEYTASRNTSLSHAASQALETLTGHYESIEESLLRVRWLDWWEQNQGAFQAGQRYRHGELMTSKLLIDRMGHDDPLVRRTCYDELVISTGVRLPSDVDGPWRVQCAHRRSWSRWWKKNGSAQPRGAWLFHGEVIG
jgi:HEAT repeat protein/predicted negative regulator of RcsB-dependent stress response